MAKLKLPFTYRNVELIRVVDGDTVRLAVDVGFHMRYVDNFRLHGIDAQERWEEGGPAATIHLEQLISEAYEDYDGLEIDVTKKDKYGRYLVVLKRASDKDDLNQRMILEGKAKPYSV